MSAPTHNEQDLSRREEMSISGAAMSGALWRARPSRAIRWARSNPWRFAVMPALACAALVLVLSVVTGGGIVGGVLSGLWHGGVVYGLTGVAAVASKSRKPAS
jgi:hypothetical protein